ncbi:hypothetical protein GOP47_0020328 [Adiantum capillus-veneris]|uniref:PROP1-like PPR domain-containing protein n=1 Tax=Adiantum capillus-veneris TaxID=13818 RepID=A0A9D4Z7Y1_ADICA|nr:hypothetical protein GOP47_0020328 [Adiantum capillus-veneris]
MVSLSIFAASTADLLQPQPLKQQVFSRVSVQPFKLHRLLRQPSSSLLINKDIRPQVHVLDTVHLQTVENPASEPRFLLQKAFLEQLALQEAKRKPSDKPTDAAGRAIAHCLRNVQQVSQVDAYLHGLQLDPHAFTTAIQKLGHWKMVEQAFILFQWLRVQPDPDKQPNVFIVSSLLSAMKACRYFVHFNFVMDEVRRRCMEPNLVMYNIIIECYERQGCHADAMSYFVELVQRSLVPSYPTFKSLLWSAENSLNLRQLLTTFLSAKDALLEAGMQNAVEELRDAASAICSRIISVGMLENKGSDYIVRLLEMAEQSTLELSAPHYDQILWDCRSGYMHCAVAKHVMTQRWKVSPPVDVGLCNHVMQLMGTEKKWWAALEVFENMKEKGPPPDETSYSLIRSQFNFLLKASKERRTCRWNMQLLEKMEAHGIKPDQYAWDTTLVACALKVDPDLAVYVFEKMIEKGHQPNVLSYGALLSTLEKGGLYDRAEQVWKHMRKMRVKPNIRAYTIMISVYGASQKYEELRWLLNEMSAAKVNWTLITYNALITVCAKANNGQGALEWMQKLTGGGFEPDDTSYSQLVIALSKGGQAELAKTMFIRSRQLGLDVSPTAVNCLIKVCSACDIELPVDLVPQLEKPSSMEFGAFEDEPQSD